MTEKEQFISNISAALGRKTIQKPEADHRLSFFESASSINSNADQSIVDSVNRSDQLMDQMSSAAETIGWKVHHASNTEVAASIVAGICKDNNAKNVLRSAHEVLDQIVVDAAISNIGASVEVTEHQGDYSQIDVENTKIKAFAADIGITGVDYAIAETGSIVLHPRSGLSRLVSLAPPIHIAVLRPAEVIASLDELFALERSNFINDQLEGSMNIISGPSKTADIEGTTVTGIHGPLEVHLVIFKDDHISQ